MMKTTASKLFARCGAGWPKPGSFPQGPQQSANSCWVQKIDVFFCWPPNKSPQKIPPFLLERISKVFGVLMWIFSEDLWEMGIYFETPFMAAAGIFFRPSSSVFRAFAFVASFLRVISIQISLNLIAFVYSQLPGTRARQPWLQMLGTTADLAGEGWKLKGWG